jgi:hypothetical protein
LKVALVAGRFSLISVSEILLHPFAIKGFAEECRFQLQSVDLRLSFVVQAEETDR